MAKLVLLQSGQVTPYELAEGDSTLGRHPDCTIQLQSNMVSRRHAQVTVAGDDYSVKDLGSGNGTFVNGSRIEGEVPLKHGDRVKLGPLLFRFQMSEDFEEAEAVETLEMTQTVGFSDDEKDAATIMGTVDNQSGFGLLDVRPEAKLKAILEISRSLAGLVDLEVMLPKILESLFSIFPHADRGCILLQDDATSKMVPRAIRHRRDEGDDSVKLSRTIVNKVIEEKTGILSADAASDDRFEASESISNLTIRSMMCVPMLSLNGEPMGIINIDTQNPLSQFKNDDLDLLLAVAGQAALSYESARLMVTYAEKQKQDNEMRIAKNVQRALLPEEFPNTPAYEFFASYEAAQAVGGDYYDVIMLKDNKACLAFGDVAGKGVPASLVMSRLSSVVRSTMEFTDDVEKAGTQINNHMCAKAVEGRFVTFVLTILDLETHEMEVLNAGHMSPIVRKPDGSIEEFADDSVGIPIGVMEDFPYEVVTRKLEPGETVVIYTDGVSEAMNHKNELYGLEHLRDFISKGPQSPTELGKQVLADVKRHADGREQNDDITLMSYGRHA